VRFAVALLLLTSCAKCGSAKSTPDAGQLESAKRVASVHTALIYIFPEYRGVAVLDTTARLTRTIPGLTNESRDEALTKLNWQRGGPGWQLNSFVLTQPAVEALEVSIPYDADQLGRQYLMSASLSSQDLGTYLPRELPAGDERFVVDIHYATSPELAARLVKQAQRLVMETGQWHIVRSIEWDGGVTDEFTVELRNDDHARIVWERVRGRVHTFYELDTRVP
jgi:hypothetical protein